MYQKPEVKRFGSLRELTQGGGWRRRHQRVSPLVVRADRREPATRGKGPSVSDHRGTFVFPAGRAR